MTRQDPKTEKVGSLVWFKKGGGFSVIGPHVFKTRCSGRVTQDPSASFTLHLLHFKEGPSRCHHDSAVVDHDNHFDQEEAT